MGQHGDVKTRLIEQEKPGFIRRGGVGLLKGVCGPDYKEKSHTGGFYGGRGLARKSTVKRRGASISELR